MLYEIYGARLGERKSGAKFLVFSIQEFVYHTQGISKHHEKATHFSSYHCDIETQATVPSLEHKHAQSKEAIGGNRCVRMPSFRGAKKKGKKKKSKVKSRALKHGSFHLRS